MVWLLFALLAPLLFAATNLFDKVLRQKHFSTLTLNTASGIFSGLAVLGFLVVSYDLPVTATLLGLLAGAVWFVAGFPYFRALSFEEASRVVPLWQLQSPVTLSLAAIFLGERLTLQSYASFALIALGAFLVSVKSLGGVFRLSQAFYLMLAASALTAINAVMAKTLYSSNSYWPVQVALLLGNFLAALAAVFLFSSLRKGLFAELMAAGAKVKALLLLRQAVGLAAFVALNFAILAGPVSLVIAISGLSSFYVLIAAVLLSVFWPGIMREVVDKKTLLTKALAIAMIIAGLFLAAK